MHIPTYWRVFVLILTLSLGAAFSLPVLAAEQSPPELAGVGIDPILGSQLPLDALLVDSTGKTVPLSTFFDGKRPVVLVLSYYGCPMLCGLVLNSTRDNLSKLAWLPGDHYRVITISIDPKETASLAAEKKKSIISASTRPEFREAATRNWEFLVGKGGSEKRISDAVGFHYKWNAEEKQWAHGAAIFLVSPTGKLTRVLFGLDFPPLDLKLGLLEAGSGKVGTIAEKLLLFCYHYDPKGNKYAILASRLVSMGGALTVLALLFAWFAWFVRVRKNSPPEGGTDQGASKDARA